MNSTRTILFLAVLLYVIHAPGAQALPDPHEYSVYTHWSHGLKQDNDDVTSVAFTEIQGLPYLVSTGSQSGLTLHSITDSGLAITGSLAIPGAEQAVAFDGEIAYLVLTGPARLVKIQIFTPGFMGIVWTDYLGADPVAVELTGQHLLISCEAGGLLVYDRTESFGFPAGVVGSWAGVVQDAAPVGSVVVALTDAGLTTLDISDPAQPTSLDSYPLNGHRGRNLALEGSLAYVGLESDVVELDLGDPANIVLSRTFAGIFPSYLPLLATASLGVSGGDLFVACSNGELKRVDLQTGGVVWLGGGNYGFHELAIGNGYMGLSSGYAGFNAYRLGASGFPPALAPFSNSGRFYSAESSGDLIFVAKGYGFSCYQMVSGQPVLAWTRELPGRSEIVTALKLVDDRLYVGYSDGLVEVLAVTLAAAVELAAWYPVAGSEILDLEMRDAHLVVFLDQTGGAPTEGLVQIYDMTDLGAPVVTDAYADNDYTNMALAGQTIVLSDRTFSGPSNGILLLDASDPANIQVGGHIAAGNNSDVTGNGNHIYVSGSPELQAWDISNPASPAAGPILPIPYTPVSLSLFVKGQTGYLLNSDLVYDLSDPMVPRPIGSIVNDQIKDARIVTVGDGYIIVGRSQELAVMGEFGIPVSAVGFPEAPLARAVSLTAVPNPFNPQVILGFSLPAAGRAEIDILDMRGRRVAVLGGEFHTGGPNLVRWKGRGENGAELPSGVYLARIITAEGHAVRKITLVR